MMKCYHVVTCRMFDTREYGKSFFAFFAFFFFVGLLFGQGIIFAQTSNSYADTTQATSNAKQQREPLADPEVFVPHFIDPHRRLDKPEPLGRLRVRLVTSADFPPFAFSLANGTLTGFEIDLARALCQKLDFICSIQSMPFETLLQAVNAGAADGAIGGLLISRHEGQAHDDKNDKNVTQEKQLRENIIFTSAYFRNPARFVAKTNAPYTSEQVLTNKNLTHVKIGVMSHTVYGDFLQTYFRDAIIVPYDSVGALRAGLQNDSVDLIFDSALASSLWLNGTDSAQCCAFVGKAFWARAYFGDSTGLAFTRDHQPIRDAFDYALAELMRDGTYREIYLKYFPVSVF